MGKVWGHSDICVALAVIVLAMAHIYTKYSHDNDIRDIQTTLEKHDFLITHGQNKLFEHENDTLENENGVLKNVVDLLEDLKQKSLD